MPRSAKCFDCRAEYFHARYEKKKGKHNAQAAAWKAANKEKRDQYAKAYREANRDKQRAYNRSYVALNRRMLKSAQYRAEQEGLPFNLDESDVVVPSHCPVLGIPLQRCRGRGFNPNSPSLDKIVPELGYVKGNVRVISLRANALKKDATPAELRAVADYAERETARVLAGLANAA